MNIPKAHEVLCPDSDAVVVDGVEPALMTFALQLAYIHWILFGLPLVITNGRETDPDQSPQYRLGNRLSFRTHDKTYEEMQVLLAVLAFAAPHQKCRVFDERVGAGGERFTLEYQRQ